MGDFCWFSTRIVFNLCFESVGVDNTVDAVGDIICNGYLRGDHQFLFIENRGIDDGSEAP